MTFNNSETKSLSTFYITVFSTYFLIRLSFVFFSGFDTCELCSDSGFYIDLSKKALVGDFNFDLGRFIVSPLYPILISLFKLAFGSYWVVVLVFCQLFLASLSGVYLYKLARDIFNSKVALLATIIFAFYPFTFWWVHSICTEIAFQSLLIISLYYINQSMKSKKTGLVILAGIIFSLTFLTKSHILLFSPLIAISYFISWTPKTAVSKALLFAFICLLFTVPFGVYNLKIHNQYVFSSNGAQFHFYTGNSPFGFQTVFAEKEKLKEINHLKYMSVAHGTVHDSIMSLPHKTKQSAYFNYALNWIKNNPKDFVQLKAANAFLFLFPGFNFRHYPLMVWLISLLISAPIFIFAYFAFGFSISSNLKKHFLFIGLYLTMFVFSVIWYNQNRFRTITIEPMLIIYASYSLILRIPFLNRIVSKLENVLISPKNKP